MPGLEPARRRAIVRDGLAVGVATGAYALSLLAFTGASQFALVGVVGAGGAPLSGMATGLLLGTRNTLYGLRLSTLLGFRGARRAAAAQLVIDESTAMSVNRESGEAARV